MESIEFAALLKAIDRCFGGPTLKSAQDKIAVKFLKVLEEQGVTLRQMGPITLGPTGRTDEEDYWS